MPSAMLVWLGGAAAATGGVMWIAKGSSILLTGFQPPLVFEAALPFFAVGLLGLGARLGGQGGPLQTVGSVVACVAAAAGVVAVPTGLAFLITVAGFGPFLGCVLLGGAILRARVFPPPWSALPLALGLGGPVLILAGGALALLDERLLEIPIVVLGFAWLLLGYAILAVRASTVETPVRVR